MTVKLFQFHALPWVRIPSTRPGCSKHLPAPFSLSFVIVQKAQDLQWCKFPMILFFWRCARNILQQMNIKHCVISNIIFKKTLILESFLGRQQKSFRLRGCKWILLHQQVKEIRALKQSLKWKWDFLAIKFPSSTLHPDQCFGIKQLSTYPTPAYWPVTKNQTSDEKIKCPRHLCPMASTYNSTGNGTKGFFSTERHQNSYEELMEITCWDPMWSIPGRKCLFRTYSLFTPYFGLWDTLMRYNWCNSLKWRCADHYKILLKQQMTQHSCRSIYSS